MDNNRQAVIAVSGIKNSGKTTLIAGLVSRLSVEGFKVAVIKHDGHDFSCDVPGTDTYKFAQSGAYGTACFSESMMLVHRQNTGESYEDLIRLFPEADIIFIEGAKNSTLPKIEVIRSAVSETPASNPEGRFLIASDLPGHRFDEPACDIDDKDTIIKIIKEKYFI